MSYCELCGHQTFEKKMVVVDGTVFNVCVACSKRGKPYVLPQIAAKRKKPVAAKPQKKIGLADETILTPNFARLIREARMKMGLTHEQLGMKMNERLSKRSSQMSSYSTKRLSRIRYTIWQACVKWR